MRALGYVKYNIAFFLAIRLGRPPRLDAVVHMDGYSLGSQPSADFLYSHEMIEYLVVPLFLMVMLAPWAYAARRMSGAKVPLWMVATAAILLATLLQVMFGANATQQIGYYGAIIFGIGLMAAVAAYFSGP